ncbi:phage virion morphogenesis protein [Pseudomonas aeruginosa]
MAGITLEWDGRRALDVLNAGSAALGDPSGLLQDIGELLLNIHRRRFQAQVSPDGTPWQPLSPAYLRRKRKNRDKILTLDGHLRNLLRYQLDGSELLFGSDRPYAAIHHFGGQSSARHAAAPCTSGRMNGQAKSAGSSCPEGAAISLRTCRSAPTQSRCRLGHGLGLLAKTTTPFCSG